MVGFGGMKSAAEPVTATGSGVHGARARLSSARGIGPSGLLELAVLFGFIVLLALFAQPVTTVGGRRAVRRAALSHGVVGVCVGLPALQPFDERRVGLLALLPF